MFSLFKHSRSKTKNDGNRIGNLITYGNGGVGTGVRVYVSVRNGETSDDGNRIGDLIA